MKHIWNMANRMTDRRDMGLVRLFLAMNTVAFGIAGCALAGVLSVVPLFAKVSFVQLLLICGGYGAFLVGLIGGAAYLVIAGSEGESGDGKKAVKKTEYAVLNGAESNVKSA